MMRKCKIGIRSDTILVQFYIVGNKIREKKNKI